MIQPFAIANIGDKSYAMPGWFEIPKGTSVYDLKSIPFKLDTIEGVKPKNPKLIESFVESSDGKSQYKVSFNGIQWSCTCVGFGFRRDCKHVKKIKQQNNV